MLVDHCGRLPLGLREDDVREVLAGGHHRNLLEIVERHGDQALLQPLQDARLKKPDF